MYFIQRREIPENVIADWYAIQVSKPLMQCPLTDIREWLMLNAGTDWSYRTLCNETDFNISGFTFYVKNAKVAVLFKLLFC
jgi:hypothetical protein